MCIYLVFNSQPNRLIESCVHQSLHPSCHHQAFSSIDVNFNMISYIFLIRLLSIYHVIYSPWDGRIWWQKSFLDEQGNQKIDSWNKNISNCFRWSINDKQLLDRLKDLQTQLNFLIEKFEGKYFTNNHIWSTLKSYFIGKKNSCIPILLENNEHFTGFKKAELFY